MLYQQHDDHEETSEWKRCHGGRRGIITDQQGTFRRRNTSALSYRQVKKVFVGSKEAFTRKA